MAQCQQCGNEYDKAFQVVIGGQSYIFDSFECAVARLAPICKHCGCRIIGHGTEAGGTFYCSAHCANAEGAQKIHDRA
jgi:Rieske Fe-S protein